MSQSFRCDSSDSRQAFNLSFLIQREEDVLLPPLTCLEAGESFRKDVVVFYDVVVSSDGVCLEPCILNGFDMI
jgi:hypothetical protein